MPIVLVYFNATNFIFQWHFIFITLSVDEPKNTNNMQYARNFRYSADEHSSNATKQNQHL